MKARLVGGPFDGMGITVEAGMWEDDEPVFPLTTTVMVVGKDVRATYVRGPKGQPWPYGYVRSVTASPATRS